jgi:hypothetical protein
MKWTYDAKQNESEVGGIECHIVAEDGSFEVLSNLGYHSPDGFQIGYGGSGPADLAYSIVMDYLLRSRKCDAQNVAGKTEFLHQDFKRDFVAVAKEHLQINSDYIGEWVEAEIEKINETLKEK